MIFSTVALTWYSRVPQMRLTFLPIGLVYHGTFAMRSLHLNPKTEIGVEITAR
jgi:hypothetical protein